MNIGFYGHSASSWAGNKIIGMTSFIDIVTEHFKANLVNKGVPQGSEERILFELKKTKELDLAIIFHSQPKFLFLPGCHRDITTKELEDKAAYMWRNIGDNASELARAKKDYFSYGGIEEKFINIENFLQTIHVYKEHLYHPDLAMNRFTGALVQIDQYVSSMNIPCIHIPTKNKIPTWFKFSSGIVAQDVEELCQAYYKLGLPNNITWKGQRVIADKLIEKIKTVFQKDKKMVGGDGFEPPTPDSSDLRSTN